MTNVVDAPPAGCCSMPHGPMILFPTLSLSIATILSIITLVNCSFVEGEHEHMYSRYYDSDFKVGLWPGCFYHSHYYADEDTLQQAFQDDTNRKISVAFGLLACIVGTGATIALWFMTCKSYSSKSICILCAAIVFAFISQLLTLTMFGTDYCKSFGCNLAWGGIVSITAASLWFIGYIGVCMIPKSSETTYIAGGTAKVADSEHGFNKNVEETAAEKETPSTNPEGTKAVETTSEKPEGTEGAFETLDV